MNQNTIHVGALDVAVVGFDDGVYNLELTGGNGETARLELTGEAADRVCALVGTEAPSVDPSPVERWS